MNRRDFPATALAAAAVSAQAPRAKRRGNVHEFAPGVKIALQVGSDPQDDDLTFVKQPGLR